MIEVEPQTSGVGSNRFTNWAQLLPESITAKNMLIKFLNAMALICSLLNHDCVLNHIACDFCLWIFVVDLYR